MVFANARCEKCDYVFEISKENTLDDFKIPNCPECKSPKVYRIFGIGCFNIAQGRMGNSKNGYETQFTEHKSELGVYKGTKYKSGTK